MNLAAREFPGAPALRYGEGPLAGSPLLLLHGVTRCGQDWEPLLSGLARDWRVLTLDHRGHGDSEQAARYLVVDYVADAVRFVREAVAAPVVILGHSLGAMVAAGVAAEAPEFVRGVVLEDPPFHTMGGRIHGSAWQAQFTGMRAAARDGGTAEALTDALAEIRLPSVEGGFKRLGDIRDRAALRWSAECLAKLDPEVLTPVIEGRWLDGYNMPDVLGRVRCPVLLLQGDPAAGGALADEDAEFALRSVAGSQRVRFPGIGHQIHWLQPEAQLRAVREFAASLSDRQQ